MINFFFFLDKPKEKRHRSIMFETYETIKKID